MARRLNERGSNERGLNLCSTIVVLVLVGAIVGCTSNRGRSIISSPPAEAPTDTTAPVYASLAQFRDDVAVRRLQIRIHNGSDHAIRVDRLGLSWPGIRLGADATPATIVSPGVMVDIPVPFSEVICGANPGPSDPPPPIEPVALGALSDPAAPPATRMQQIPVVDGLSVLGRIYTADCRVQSVHEVVDVSLGAWSPAGAAPDAPEAGTLRLVRQPESLGNAGRPAPEVQVDGFSGSVLLDLEPAVQPPAGEPVATLGTDAQRLDVPVIASSNGRCDGHALGGSSQTFVLQVHLRIGGESIGIDLVVDPADQASVYGAIERGCGLTG